MAERYENSSEEVFRKYGYIFVDKLPNIFRLEELYNNNPLEFPTLFPVLKTSLIYTIGSFLFFKDEVSIIAIEGEAKSLSLYVFFINAIKNLGDAIGIMGKIEKPLLESRKRAFDDNKILWEKSDEIFSKYLKDAKVYRNFLVHTNYAELIPDNKKFKIDLNRLRFDKYHKYLHERLFKCYPSPIPVEEFIELLFNDVALGIDLKCKYLIDVYRTGKAD